MTTTTVAPRKIRSAELEYKNGAYNRSEDETVFMVLDMHENLMTPVENLGRFYGCGFFYGKFISEEMGKF